MSMDPEDILNSASSVNNSNDLNDYDDSDGEIEYLPREENEIHSHVPLPLQVPKPENKLTHATGFGVDDIAEESTNGYAFDAEMHAASNLPMTDDIKHQTSYMPLTDNSNQMMQAMGLPTNFANGPGSVDNYETKYSHGTESTLPPNLFSGAGSYQGQETVRKGQKETFYCEICFLELNSRDTLISHAKGAKHKKKEEEHMADVRRAKNKGQYIEEKTIKKIANPLPLQKKVPIRLSEKLRETTTAIVGLASVHEIIACSNAEVEPYYECAICGQQGEANSMFQHLQGKSHRIRFFQHTYPNERKYIDTEFNKNLLEIEIDKLGLRENNQLDKINTVYSDELFPWTAGKAPWSVEQGGTGNIPTRARNKIGLISQHIQPVQKGFGAKDQDSKEGIKKIEPTTFKDLNPEKLDGNLDTDYDLKHACALVQKLGEKIRNYKISHDKESQLEIELAYDQLDVIMETLSLTDDTSDENSHTKRTKRSKSPRRSNSRDKIGSPTRHSNRDRPYNRNDRDRSRENDHHKSGRGLSQGRNYQGNGRSLSQGRDYDRAGRSSRCSPRSDNRRRS